MSDTMLVLSLFPGIGLLDRAFEEESFCVVRGPDLIWGGNIRGFHPPAGKFDGVIGGPPCQEFSPLRHLLAAQGRTPRHGNLIPEYERCTGEAKPKWFLMENVPDAPTPVVEGYSVHSFIMNNRWIGAVQHRERRFSFGTREGLTLDLSPDLVLFEANTWEANHTVLAGHGPTPGQRRPQTVIRAGVDNSPAAKGRGNTVLASGRPTYYEDGKIQKGPRYTLAEMCELQGLPSNFFGPEVPLTMEGKRSVIGNGVPIPLGRALARAVKQAIGAS